MTVFLRFQDDLYLGSDRALVAVLFPDLESRWAKPDRGRVLVQALAVGALLALGLYHLILFTRLRERTYLLFALALLGRLLLITTDNQVLLELVWPDHAFWDFHFRLFQNPL